MGAGVDTEETEKGRVALSIRRREREEQGVRKCSF